MRALSLCACCRHYPGAATGRRSRSSHPAVTAFPDNVVGSACTSSFSRIAQRSLALRPAHSRGHLYVTCYTEGFSHFVTSMTAPVLPAGAIWPGGACTHWKAPPCHGAHVKRTLQTTVVDASIGRRAGLHGSLRERPESGRKAVIYSEPKIAPQRARSLPQSSIVSALLRRGPAYGGTGIRLFLPFGRGVRLPIWRTRP